MYKNINDYEQLYLISENEDDAKEIIFRKYRPIVISLAKKYYSLVGPRNDIDDFIQEGYIGLDRAINSYNESENALFYTFCTICIERQIQAYCRKIGRQKNIYFNDSLSLDLEIGDKSLKDIISDEYYFSNPIKCMDNTFYIDELTNFKNSLDLKYSTIFELRYNGFKYKEISRLMDINLGIIDNYVHIIKEKLKNYMSKL